MNHVLKLAKQYALTIFAENQASSAMAKYTAMLRGLSIIHQQAHWTSKAENYYGDHLLLDRLYESVTKNVDSAAERTIGLYGAKALTLKEHMETAASFVKDIEEKSEKLTLIDRSLLAEETFLKFSKELYDSLKSADALSLGLDDLIMSISSDHEENVYLLRRRVSLE